MPPAGTNIGGVTATLYGQTVSIPFLQPGTVNGHAPRSDQLAIEQDGRWLVMSLRAALLEVDRRMPRILTTRERGR